ncbi:MAG TPA: MmcQ/YjbR family DNA-binding protein [Candidatus Caenarcaniphilales bacterium]|nr:MmcQ/YjbR family DNA-binding protein [Candidatus Caenarcaniphilales bacterium]
MTMDDVRRIALALPGATVDASGLAFRVGGKLFAWPWLERIDTRRARVPNTGVLAVRLADEMEKQLLIDMNPDVFFTEPHYDGYAAILVRLAAIDEPLLGQILTDACEPAHRRAYCARDGLVLTIPLQVGMREYAPA